jgi:serine/threonine protein kinase
MITYEGWGHFSTVWLCYDKKAKISNTPEFVALKIQKSAPHYREAALDEIELLKCVANTAFILQQSLNQNDAGKIGNQQNMKILYDPCVVMLYDHFDHVGQYGRHICMTFETLGENLYKVIQKYGYHGIPISITKNMIRQICIGLDFLHRHCNIIHTDLKPENILVAMEPKLPDPDYLNSLIKSNDTSNKIQLSKKSNGRKSSIGSHNNQSSPQNHNSSPSKQIQTFEIHENLTVEQKKKLKKKMKRKRQQARKNSTKKPTTTSRGSRNNGRRKSTRNKTATSLEKAMTEMRMMELDSIPLASLQCGGNNNNKTSSGDRMPLLENEIDNETKASNDDDYDSANVRNQENFSKAINAASRLNLDTNTIKNTSTDERDDAAEEIYGDYFDGEENFDEKDIMSMPVWTRPTLFSYLNLDWQNEFESYDGHETANSDDNYFIFDKSIAIDKSEWTKPSHGQYAKISMVS